MRRLTLNMMRCGAVLILLSATGSARAQPAECDAAPECSTIAGAEALGGNFAAAVCNVVVSSKEDLINSANSKNFHVQDASGGATIFGSNAVINPILAQIEEGDSITIEGTTDFFNGLFEIVNGTQPLVVSTNGIAGIPTPDLITASTLADGNPAAEFHESRLARMECVLFTATGNFTGSTNYTVIDSTGSAVVRISRNDMDFTTPTAQPIPTTPVDIVGVVGQFDGSDPRDGGYQFQPRRMADFTPNNTCPIPELPPTATGGLLIGYQAPAANSDMTLQGTPGNRPGATTRFRIKSLPASGTLRDGGAGGPVITTLPHTVSGSVVHYTPNSGFTGLDQFNFDVWNGLSGANERFSTEATQRLAIQAPASVFISEFMANPSGGNDFDPANPQEEWIEIYNPTGSAVALGHIGDATTPDFPINTNGNLEETGISIPANSAMIIAHSHAPAVPTTEDTFICCWGLTSQAAKVKFVHDVAGTGVPPTDWKGLNNAGDVIYLYDVNGGLLDAVAYRALTPPPYSGSWPADNGFGSAALMDFDCVPPPQPTCGDALNSTTNDNGANWAFHDPLGGLEDFLLFGMYDSCASGAANDASIKHDRGSPLHVSGLTEPPTPGVPPTPQNGSASVATPATFADITLASTNGVIESLPTGILEDPNGGQIITVPYTLEQNGVVVRYTPPPDAAGTDSFQFSAAGSCQQASISVGFYTFPAGPELCLIISEVVDGGRTSGTPKWVEITNTGGSAYTFPQGGLIVQSNTSADVDVDVDLTGVTLPVNEKYVIASCGNNGAAVFLNTYGFDADLYTTAAFGNGNDRYMITNRDDGSNMIDIYGDFGLDGTGKVWEYTDGYAFRKPAFTTGSGAAFDSTQWSPDPAPNRAESLEAGTNDAGAKALLLSLSTPNAHTHAAGCISKGACCAGLECTFRTPASCSGGAIYQGDGELCVPLPCGPTGACCLDEFGCTADLTFPECEALGGLFWNQGQPCSSCPPAATVTSAVSRRTNPHVSTGGSCDTATHPTIGVERHSGGVRELRITFDTAPATPSSSEVMSNLSQATCAAPAFAPYSGPAAVTPSVAGNTLVLSFLPGLETGKKYRLTIPPSVTSIADQGVQVRSLAGDADGNGLANSTDRSVVVGVWTGTGFTCNTDIDSSGATNSTDRSLVVGAWTGGPGANCAP